VKDVGRSSTIVSDVKMRAGAVAVSLSMLFSAACAPMSVSFYRPDSAHGKVVKAWCPPVRSVILFDVYDVIVGFEVTSPQENRVLATMMFEIPEKHSVLLIEHAIEIQSPTQASSWGDLTGRVWVSAGRTGEISLKTPMHGKTEERFFDQITRYGKTKHAYYFLRAEITAIPLEKLSLKPPRFLVDGMEVDLPIITFSRTSESYVGSLNC
jgi:hypothetical protein